MRTRILKAVAPLLACVLVVAVCQQASAKPAWGSGCTGCHGAAGGDLTTSPNPVGIDIDSNGLVTFNILDNPGVGAIALTGLDDAGLDATVLGGGWTDAGSYYYSTTFAGTAPYSLDLGIGPAAVEGAYGIGIQFAGQGGSWGGAYDLGVNVLTVIPEPGSILLLLSGSMLCLVGFRRRRDA